MTEYIATGESPLTLSSYAAADDPYWTVSWEGVKTGTVNMPKADSKAMLDTTVPFIIATKDDYVTMVRGLWIRPDCKQHKELPDRAPDITFNIGG